VAAQLAGVSHTSTSRALPAVQHNHGLPAWFRCSPCAWTLLAAPQNISHPHHHCLTSTQASLLCSLCWDAALSWRRAAETSPRHATRHGSNACKRSNLLRLCPHATLCSSRRSSGSSRHTHCSLQQFFRMAELYALVGGHAVCLSQLQGHLRRSQQGNLWAVTLGKERKRSGQFAQSHCCPCHIAPQLLATAARQCA
jgi:hypothetical protein